MALSMRIERERIVKLDSEMAKNIAAKITMAQQRGEIVVIKSASMAAA